MEDKKNSSSEKTADLFKYTSVQRISKIPVVESGYNYVAAVYTRVKNSNRLIRWSLVNVEGGIQLAVDKTMPTVQLLDLPLTVVDSIICKGLDTVAVAIPAINYPPEQIVNMSKDYVNSNLITPVLKRADSVKQLGLSEASRVGEMAASRLDNALDIADKYVDRYLPDSTESADKNDENTDKESKATHAINHMNRLGKKLQRRLTKRTLMEAEALRQGGQDMAQALLYLADLLLRDPKGFADKIKELWNTLSEDEPENQVPPANLEQLVALLARESARRVVHIANFVVSTLPAQSAHAFRFTLHHIQLYSNYFLKVVHLEGAKGIAFATSSERLAQLRSFVLNLLEFLGSRMKETKGRIETIPLRPVAAIEPKQNTDSNASTSQNQPSTTENNQNSPKTPSSKKTKKSQNKEKESPSKLSSSSADISNSPSSENSSSSTLDVTTNSTPYLSPA